MKYLQLHFGLHGIQYMMFNLQLAELQFYINNIKRYLVKVVVLYARIKYHQFNTLIKCSTFLQFYYLQIIQQDSVIHSTLQA